MTHPGIRRYLKHGTLTQLRLFEATARLGNFTRAAHELHLSQPAASAQIKKLTETVGLPLFEQVGKHLYLTEAGRHLQLGCGEIFGAFERVEEQLADMRGLASGRLSLAVSSIAKSFVPRLLGAFLEEHPGVEVSVQVMNRALLEARLAANQEDLYLFPDAPCIEGVVVQELLPNPLVVLARDDHPLAREKAIPFARLAQEPFLLREDGSGTRRATLRLFREHGLAPRVRMELGTSEAIKEAILAGQGVSIQPRFTYGLDPESPRYACLDVEGFPIENHWYFAYPPGKQLSAAARAFLDFARLRAKSLVREGYATA